MAHILDGDGLRTRAGWSCPGCGRCWNPDVLACHHCPDGNTGKAPDENPEPEPIVYTARGPVPFSAFACAGPPPPNKPSVPAIFVPLRDVPGMTPSRMADLQRMLNDMPAVMFGDVVDGKFIVLPVGAKILPAHPGREWIKVPPEMTDPHYERIVTARREWGQVWPGLECLLSSFGGVNEDAQATIVLRLARPAEDSR